MAGNFNKPNVTDQYTSVLQSLKDLIADTAKGFDGTGTANTPAGVIRWSSTNKRFEKYNGTTWVALVDRLAVDVNSVQGRVPGSAAGNLPVLSTGGKMALTDLPVGSGNGLDADKLDGLHSSSFVSSHYINGTRVISDLNNTSSTGLTVYYAGSNSETANKPFSATGFAITFSATSGYSNQLCSSWQSNEWLVRNQSNSTWGSWAKLAHSQNAPGAFNLGPATTYGSFKLRNSKNSTWDGFEFGTSTNQEFITNGTQIGEHRTSAGWQWRWDNGVLAVGTVPWARISGAPAQNFLPLTGGTLSGSLGTNGNLTVTSTAPRIFMADSDWGTRSIYAQSGLMGFLTNAGSWEMYTNNSGQMWTSNYGWLHDYFSGKNSTFAWQQVGVFTARRVAQINCYTNYGSGIYLIRAARHSSIVNYHVLIPSGAGGRAGALTDDFTPPVDGTNLGPATTTIYKLKKG